MALSQARTPGYETRPYRTSVLYRKLSNETHICPWVILPSVSGQWQLLKSPTATSCHSDLVVWLKVAAASFLDSILYYDSKPLRIIPWTWTWTLHVQCKAITRASLRMRIQRWRLALRCFARFWKIPVSMQRVRRKAINIIKAITLLLLESPGLNAPEVFYILLDCSQKWC